MNYIINKNKKNLELIRNDINQLNNKFDELKINITKNNKELKYDNKRYIGQVVNGLPEGKGIAYYNNGNIYEGYWRNGKKEGKGIMYYDDGARYEGDWRNGKFEGKGIFYYNNGDRSMSDFYNDKPIGKIVILTKNGIVKEEKA